MARQELARLSKPTFLSVSIILIFWGLVIMGVLILFGVIDIGGKPCEQHTVEEAFIAAWKVLAIGINWSKSGLVPKETPESAWCNLRLKSVFNESLGTYR